MSPPQIRPRPVGRPARVDADVILKAALDIGLDKVTMKAVADRLGVGISTLYQYVKNRSELVRLAALQQVMTRRPPENAAAHWADVAIHYAEDLFRSLLNEPQLIVELMKGGLGPHLEAEILERFLGDMQAHGFCPDDGVRFYRSISMVTIGAAVGALNYASAHAAGSPHRIEIRRVLAEREAHELPLIRAGVAEYQREDNQIWFTALYELLAGVAAGRRETLPPTLVASFRVTPAGNPVPTDTASSINKDGSGTTSIEDARLRNPQRRNSP